MNMTLFLLGVCAVAVGIVGWVANARVNGSPLARGGTDTAVLDGGFTDAPAVAVAIPAAGAEDPFSYEGKVDHVPGFKRRIFASIWLVVMIGIVGTAFAGTLYLSVRVLIDQIIKYVGD